MNTLKDTTPDLTFNIIIICHSPSLTKILYREMFLVEQSILAQRRENVSFKIKHTLIGLIPFSEMEKVDFRVATFYINAIENMLGAVFQSMFT